MRAAVDGGEMDQGDAREETVVGNACGGKPGSHGSKAILLSHVKPVEPSPSPLSPTHQHWEPNNRGWPIKHLMH